MLERDRLMTGLGNCVDAGGEITLPDCIPVIEEYDCVVRIADLVAGANSKGDLLYGREFSKAIGSAGFS